MKKYSVELTTEQRKELSHMVSTGKASARELTHVGILLKADQGPQGPGWSDRRIQEALEVSASTVQRMRKCCVQHGVQEAILFTRQSWIGRGLVFFVCCVSGCNTVCLVQSCITCTVCLVLCYDMKGRGCDFELSGRNDINNGSGGGAHACMHSHHLQVRPAKPIGSCSDTSKPTCDLSCETG
jgi:hypothetical protein